VVPLFTSQTARRAHRPAVQLAAPKMVGTVRKSAPLPTLRNSLLASHHLFLSSSLPSFRCPLEGRAERRWRLDACDAPRSACHDRHADASLDRPPRPKPRLAFIAHRGRTRRAIDLRNRANPIALSAHRASPTCAEASCVPSDGDARLAALHVGFLARARARRCPACPPRSCGNLTCRTGHRYPEERVSRASPARSLTASGTPQPRSALQERL
jgi:hypothetical protein